ncbi:MFS transporter [Zhihengliuella halotolerans]|uniref:MFS-type transporter involved in bile tolerance (Atg22 family) n=1 Tax=Zhihengliuella halotolerans TaxID=370736 RepID=A0A4Q8AFJ3_9MICC|nr:MFS transporter [Zhihengliuella halotolerans]RZU63097.1 MFS-type transporter involved in bile tolerance (Atg22 family) [Zhihengliuella halotolerans]
MASAADTATGRQARPSLLRRLYVSNGADIAGRSLADYIVDVVAVTMLGATAMQMGALNILQTLPMMLLAVPIGVLIDRRPTSGPLIGSQILRAIVVAVLVFVASADALTLTWIAAFVLLSGLLATFAEAGQAKAVLRASDPGRAGGAYGVLQATDSAAGIVVPAAAGVLLAQAGAPTALAVSAALALVGGAALLTRAWSSKTQVGEIADAKSSMTGPAAFAREAGEGFAVIWRIRRLRYLTGASFLLGCGLAAYSAIEAIYVLRDLRVAVVDFGIIVSAGAAGGLIGSLVSGPFARCFGRLRLTRMTFVLTIMCALLLFVPLMYPRAAVPVLALQFLLWGVFVVANNVQVAALVVEIVPESAVGRVIATRRTATMASILVGSVFGGALGGAVGTEWVLVLFVGLLAGAAICAFRAD